MKTRFTSLVKIKKNDLNRCEMMFQKAALSARNAKQALKMAYNALKEIDISKHGKMRQLLANQALVQYQRLIIKDKLDWLAYANHDLQEVKKILQNASLEYEKFKYLEFQEMDKILKKQKIAAAKELDEIAILTYNLKER